MKRLFVPESSIQTNGLSSRQLIPNLNQAIASFSLVKTTKDQTERKRMIIFQSSCQLPVEFPTTQQIKLLVLELFISVNITNFYQKYLCHLVRVIGVKIITVHWGDKLISENVQSSYLLISKMVVKVTSLFTLFFQYHNLLRLF